MAKIGVFVVGSLHLDVVVDAPRLPVHDETLTGSAVTFACGGKGGNQAVAAARHGARTAMAGRLGDDMFAARLRAHLAQRHRSTPRQCCGCREMPPRRRGVRKARMASDNGDAIRVTGVPWLRR